MQARPDFIPYGRQSIDEEDIAAVVKTLRSDWLTTGPAVEHFENDVCTFTGTSHGVAVSSGTAALHAAMFALNINTGDEVIVPTMTFAATANCVVYQGGTPVFVDVLPDALLIDPAAVEAAITPRTRAIIGVDYAGQPCNWDSLRAIANKHSLTLIADSCHSLGAKYKNHSVGTLADITVFSFHPVKHITTGEGGMAVTNDKNLATRMRTFRNHGITTTASQREKSGAWQYEMTDMGYNYRITDIQCALGSSQLTKLADWIQKRNELAQCYDSFFAKHPQKHIRPLVKHADKIHAYHLYIVRHPDRDEAFNTLRKNKIGANVHYIPVHLHPYYQRQTRTQKGQYPVAEKAFDEILTLPLWQGMDLSLTEHVTSFL